MDRFHLKFLSQFQKIQKNLEHVLTQDWGPQSSSGNLINTEFEVLTDLQHLDTLGMSLPIQEPERSHTLFLRLAPYFEAGLELKSLRNASSTLQTWKLESSFDQGQPVQLLPEDLNFSFELRPFSLVEVRRVSLKNFLETRKSELVFLSEKSLLCSTALLLRPTENNLWLFISNIPDLFLKNHISQIHEKVIRLLSDLTDDK